MVRNDNDSGGRGERLCLGDAFATPHTQLPLHLLSQSAHNTARGFQSKDTARPFDLLLDKACGNDYLFDHLFTDPERRTLSVPSWRMR